MLEFTSLLSRMVYHLLGADHHNQSLPALGL